MASSQPGGPRDGEPKAPQSSTVDAEPRNLVVLVGYSVALRCGWIFKTESVVMPAVVDLLVGPTGAAGTVRGLLPLLNKLGQSIPPLILADVVRRLTQKKWALVMASGAMAVSFWGVAALWASRNLVPTVVATTVFLALYALFFAAVGINGLAFNTVQGKLIRPERRGRLLAFGTIVGSVLAVATAWLLMPGWLNWPNADGFVPIFAVSATGYAIGALFCMAIREQPSHAEGRGRTRPFHDMAQLLRGDRWFRRTAIVAALAASSHMLFPHYQWIGREFLGADLSSLFWWVMAQNLSVAIAGPLAGHLGDKFGNRLALRTMVGLSLLPPLIAGLLLWSVRLGGSGGGELFWVVFALLGLTPVTVRTLMNYTLELTTPENHPRYLASTQTCFAVPFLLSPLAGVLVDSTIDRADGVTYLIGILTAALLIAFLLTFRLIEMRDQSAEP